MTQTNAPKSAGEMLADVLGNVGNLVRNEIDLARTELAGDFRSAGMAVGAILIAALLGLTGLNVLTASLIAVLVSFDIPPHWATLIVGVAFILAAVIIAATALKSLKLIGFVPTRAARNLKRDAAAIKDAYNDK